MDPEFQRALTVVLVVGSIIIAIGTIGLFFIFRGFGKPGAGRSSHLALIAALLGFVLSCSVLLLIWAYH
jgi:hypothetical protein